MPGSVRHHSGIRQSGENKGMLKKGWKYSDCKVKKGCLRPIVKAKKSKSKK